MNQLDLFREKYTYINDETLEKCAKEDPSFLIALILSGDISDYSISCAIDQLSYTNNESYLDLFKKWSQDEREEVSISGYYALDWHYTHNPQKFIFIYDYFKEMKNIEKRVRVLNKINGLLDSMELNRGHY